MDICLKLLNTYAVAILGKSFGPSVSRGRFVLAFLALELALLEIPIIKIDKRIIKQTGICETSKSLTRKYYRHWLKGLKLLVKETEVTYSKLGSLLIACKRF